MEKNFETIVIESEPGQKTKKKRRQEKKEREGKVNFLQVQFFSSCSIKMRIIESSSNR